MSWPKREKRHPAGCLSPLLLSFALFGTGEPFATLEPSEPTYCDVLAQLGDGLLDQLAYGLVAILYEGLLQQAHLAVVLLDTAGDDLLDHVLRLPFGLGGIGENTLLML